MHNGLKKDKSNKAENGKGIEGALGPGGLRGRVFGAAHGETEGLTPGPGGPLDRRVPHGRARWTCLTLSVNQPGAARAGRAGAQAPPAPGPSLLLTKSLCVAQGVRQGP
jgi:hypothetical protein